MNAKGIKAKLAAGDVTVGTWQSIPGAAAAEILATTGVDWICIDMEHGTASLDQAAQSFVAAERRGVAGFARIASADGHLARALLDAGAHGVIVSTVEDAADFADFVSFCRYPPKGRRGVGLSRCNAWGDDFDTYIKEFEPVIVAQIETRKGVSAAPAIAAIDGVDALFIGPYDLSASLGKTGDFTTPDFLAARDALLKASADAGVAAGIHQVQPDPAALAGRIKEGYRFLAYGTDAIAIRTALKR